MAACHEIGHKLFDIAVERGIRCLSYEDVLGNSVNRLLMYIATSVF